jgi:hypothetical protein
VSPAAPVPAATITIARRFRGPAESGNGGYVCGRLAAHVAPAPAAVRVRLRVPPPLDRQLAVEAADGAAVLRGDDPAGAIIAEARALAPGAADFAVVLPAAPTFDEASAAARGFRGLHAHPYPGCFVCGPDRAGGDGLRIFPGPLAGRPEVAAPWVPDASLAAPGDPSRIAPEFIWAALDCPGCFAFTLPPDRTFLLGELAVERRGEVAVGERCVALGWELGIDGRKHFVATALFGEDGTCRGVGRATWFEVPATVADAASAPSRKETPA